MRHLLRALLALQRPTSAGSDSRFRASDFMADALRFPLSAGEVSALRHLRERRRSFESDRTQFQRSDHGAGHRAVIPGMAGSGGDGTSQTVRSLYKSSSIPHRWGGILFRLVRTLKPVTLLELGTCLGISASYLQAAIKLNGRGTLTTIEGDPALAALAGTYLESFGAGSPRIIAERFLDVLPRLLDELRRIDFVFIDGHHEYKATCDYFAMIEPFMADNAVVVFDDISPWFPGVRRAWKEISAGRNSMFSFDTGKLGFLIRVGSESILR